MLFSDCEIYLAYVCWLYVILFNLLFPVFQKNLSNVSFYRAMLCIRGTSHGPVSVRVRPSVTSRSSTKTAKRRITQTTPHDTPGSLVF